MKKLKILVIDDTDAMITLISTNLFYDDIDSANNGFEGLAKFENNIYDIVICDYSMPGMNGDEVIKRIRKISNIPIIAMSSTEEFGEKMLEYGANIFVIKTDFEKLNEIVHSLINLFE